MQTCVPRLTTKRLREIQYRHYREEPYFSPPSLPDALVRQFQGRFSGPSREDIESLYQSSLAALVDSIDKDNDSYNIEDGDEDSSVEEDDDNISHSDDEACPEALTPLGLLLDYDRLSEYGLFVIVFHALPSERFKFSAKRSLVTFAIYEGALGPSIPFCPHEDELSHDSAYCQFSHLLPQQFQLLDDETILCFEEEVYDVPRGHDWSMGNFIERFLKEWIKSDREREKRYTIFCCSPTSRHTLKEALKIMNS